jgi:hypothetical protein
MTSYVFGVIAIVLALTMIVYGRGREGVPRPFLRSDTVATVYTLILVTLLVIGVALIFFGAR